MSDFPLRASGDGCPNPRCGGDLILVDPADEEWQLDPEDYDDDAEVWLCADCGWNEEATPEESLEEASLTLEWLAERLGGGA